MITWPIFLALLFSIIAVYFSVKFEDSKLNKKRQEKEKDELKKMDLEERKERIKNEKK